MSKVWGRDLVFYWRAHVPPCRPSRFELDICSELVRQIRSRNHTKKPRILVLGATVEFRDWAFEEACDVVVIDNSLEYYTTISEDRRYKRAPETLIIQPWQTMNFNEEFDLVVGDLVIGNIDPDEVEQVVANVHSALVPNGVFATKSFFYDPSRPRSLLDQVFIRYEQEQPLEDPFPILTYDLAIHSMNPDNFMLQFSKMFDVVKSAHNSGLLSKKTMERYSEFGWDQAPKIEFYVMPIYEWEQILNKYFYSVKKYYGVYHWSPDFPFYLSTK